MILFKKIDPETALRMIAQVLGENMPPDLASSDAELSLSFDEDHSVDVFLIEPEEKPS